MESSRKSRYRLQLLLLVSQLALGMSAKADGYLAKAGDSLSQVVSQHWPGPNRLYGKGGRLEQVFKLNPQIQNPNDLAVGTWVQFPDSGREVAAEEPAKPEPRPPEPALTPVTLPAAVDLSEEEPQWGLGLSAQISYLRIDAKDVVNGGSATLLSDAGAGVGVSAKQNWDKGLETYQTVEWTSYRFIDPQGDKTIKNPGPLTDLKFGISQSLHSSSSYGAYAGVRQRLFAKSLSTTEYTFERLPVALAGLSARLALLQRRRLCLGVSPSAEYLFSSSSDTIKAHAGYSGALEVYITYEKSRTKIKTGLVYRQSKQDANIVNQREADLSANLSIEGWVW